MKKICLLFLFLAAAGSQGLGVQERKISSPWQWFQEVAVEQPGLIKIELPFATIDQARGKLEDLRLLDSEEQEIPYLIEESHRRAETLERPVQFKTQVAPGQTLVVLESGIEEDLQGVVIHSPSTNFVKGVTIEGSADGRRWNRLVENQAIFHHPDGTSQHRLNFAKSKLPYLKIALDDTRTPAVPVSAVELIVAAVEKPPARGLACEVVSREEYPGETRLFLKLPFRNLPILSLRVNATDNVFSRRIELVSRQHREGEILESAVTEGTIHRIVGSRDESSSESIEINHTFPGREAVLKIFNGDNPPLGIDNIQLEVAPTYLIFSASRSDFFYLALGNQSVRLPEYDLVALRNDLGRLEFGSARIGDLRSNPAYVPAEVLPEYSVPTVAFDPKGWEYRRKITVEKEGIQRLELDLHSLGNSKANLSDLRIVQEGRQVPYILDRTGRGRQLSPQRTDSSPTAETRLTRWTLSLHHKGLPLTHVSCETPEAVFRRSVVLYEEPLSRRGRKEHRAIGSATWIRSRDAWRNGLSVPVDIRPVTDTLVLEIDNGDNPPLQLDDIGVHYRAPLIFFKVAVPSDTWLYYGNTEADAPVYDLALLADDLMNAESWEARIEADAAFGQNFEGTSGLFSGWGQVLFWAALILVVVVLMGVISRLLPASPREGGE